VPSYGSVHRGGGVRSRISSDAYEDARAAVAEFLSCPEGSSVVFVRNTTEAANVLSIALPARSRILCSPIEHHANLLPWQSHRTDFLPFTASLAEFLVAVEESLACAQRSGSPYRLLAVTGASNVTGEVTPLPQLAALAHSYGAMIFVDAAQLAPHRQIDLRDLDVDFLAFSGHKVYAPFGTGALIVRDEAVRNGIPLMKGGGAVRLVTLERVALADPPRRYEAETPNLVGAVALGAACNALAAVGMAQIAHEERELAERLWDGLSAIDGVRLLRLWDDVADRVGVATFIVDGTPSHDIGRLLADEHAIAVRSGSFCAHPLVAHLLGVDAHSTRHLFEQICAGEEVQIPGAVRASIGIGTTIEDIDALLGAVSTLAATG
jgi:selenocysteine lyase/cysteine desulfurase